MTGPKVAALFESRDPHGPAVFPVAWADESKSENWFDIGREYTEWWHHQAQIRDAVRAQALAGREWLHPVLKSSSQALARCDDDTAWRLFFNALSEKEARQRIQTEGDAALIDKLFSVRGVMV